MLHIKYRPRRIKDLLLSARLHETMRALVTDIAIPHLLVSGASGCGKHSLVGAFFMERVHTDVHHTKCDEYSFKIRSKSFVFEVMRNRSVTIVNCKNLLGQDKSLLQKLIFKSIKY